MEYRSAAANDAESIALLHAESWRRSYRGMMPDAFLDGPVVADRRAVWRERLDENRADRFTCVALDRSRVVGFICVLGAEDSSWGSYIDNLHVDLSHQRSGIGAALMRRTGQWLLEHYPDCGIYLWVMEANLSARSFYERLGGRNCETAVKSDPGGGRAPNCRYAWDRPAMLAREPEP